MIQPSKADIKQDLEKYVNKAMILIHAPETRDAVLKSLGGEDPVQRLASTAVMIMQKIDSAGRDAGIEVQDSVKVIGAHQIVDMINEVATAAGLFNLNQDLSHLALSVTVQDYVKAEVAAKRIDSQKLKVAMERDLRTLPPKIRKEAQQSPARLQQIARKYNHGKGLSLFPPDPKGTAKSVAADQVGDQAIEQAPVKPKGLLASAGGA